MRHERKSKRRSLRAFKSVFLFALLSPLLLITSQNCSSFNFGESLPTATSAGSGAAASGPGAAFGPGEGYGGMTVTAYVVVNPGGLCADGGTYAAKILAQMPADGSTPTNAQLVRNDCQTLQQPQTVTVSFGPDNSSLTYDNQTFTQPALTAQGFVMNAIQGSPLKVTFNVSYGMNLSFDAVPLGMQGYGFCVHYLDSNNDWTYSNSFWPPETSDVWSGNVTFVAQDQLPTTLQPGTYSISGSICRWTGVQFDFITMATGPGVTPSPEGYPSYIIGTVTVGY